ncbi:hypothetical protein [Ralstonia pseudosolanacearum]
MAFVVDGAEWCFDGWPAEQISTALGGLLERVWVALGRGETVWIGDDLQTQVVMADHDIWSLWGPDSAVVLPIELQQELAAWLGRAPRYADERDWPEGVDDALIRIGQAPPTENPDVAWAHYHVHGGRAVACLSFLRDGPLNTRSRLGDATVHWVKTESAHKNFWRSAVDVERDNEATLERLAPHAFPNLHFHTGVWAQLGRFDGGYDAVRQRLRFYLAALDDHGHWAFTGPPPALRPEEAVFLQQSAARPTNQLIERRFHGLALTMAPENPDVHRDRTCRKAREIELGQHTLYCEWHGKLEPHRNRVYVHPPVPGVIDKVVIAIFHEHLPLPGG